MISNVRHTARLLVVALVSMVVLASLTAIASAESQVGGDEGCTPGYWKTHLSNWPSLVPGDDDYGNGDARPTTIIDHRFTDLAPFGLGAYESKTLSQALGFKGGSDLDGAAQILFRAAAAAWLNAADDRIAYPYKRWPGGLPTVENIHDMVGASLGDHDAMLAVATKLDAANNGEGGCPL
jgi:hypothetical protein